MTTTTNYEKHISSNPIQRKLLDNFNKRLIALITESKAGSILDAGCGEGFTLSLLKRSKLGKKLVGIDFEDDALKLAQKINPLLNISKASIYDLPYKNNEFDLVICSEVLEHLTDPVKAISEIVRVSKKYVLISVPNEPYFMLANFLRGKYLSHWGNHPEHINHWTSSAIKLFAESHGLKVKKIFTPFAWTILLGVK